MYKATITRANGKTYDVYSKDKSSLLELTSILIFNMKGFYTGIDIFATSTVKSASRVRIGYYDLDGKYTETGEA